MRSKTSVTLLALLLSVGGASCIPQIFPAPTPTPTATPTPTLTPTPISTPTPASTPTPTPTSTPTTAPTPTPTPEQVEINVYFTDSERYVEGEPPYEVPVSRFVDPSAELPEAVVREFFEGPTEEERERELVLIDSGFTGFSSLTIDDGIARIYLTGSCQSLGATYTVAQPLIQNLLQFPEIDYVKIYDEQGNTQFPEGESHSIPVCLEP